MSRLYNESEANCLFQNPIRAIKLYSSISLVIVLILYLLANVAYIASVPLAELKAAKQITAALFFQKVFGRGGGFRFFNFLIALSAFGNLLAGNIGISRITRESGRQGVLPYPRFWASTKPFGTPLGPYVVKYLLTVLLILAPPAGDAFNFRMLHSSNTHRSRLDLLTNSQSPVFKSTPMRFLTSW